MERQNGFTLIELLTAIMIISLIMSLAGPAYKGGGRSDLNIVARKLMSDMRYARSVAISKGENIPVNFDFANKTYRVGDNKEVERIPDDVDVSFTFDLSDISQKSGRVNFYPDGTSSGGIVEFMKQDKKVKVTTSWFNGGVSLER